MVKHFELMEIHRVRKEDGYHDFDADLPEYNDTDMVDSNSEAIGTGMDIVRYLLKHELKGYKLVRRTNKC